MIRKIIRNSCRKRNFLSK